MEKRPIHSKIHLCYPCPILHKNAKKILTLGGIQSIIHKVTHIGLRKDD